jgi:spore maturation protein CgeB
VVRILQVIEASTNLSVPNSQTWRRNLHEPLLEMGHDVVLFPAEKGRQAMRRCDERARARFSESLVATFRREHARQPFSLFFAYLMDGMVDAGAIDEIRRTGVPTANFSCNNAHQFHLVATLSKHFDYSLHAERDVREKFTAAGAHPLWWPMAANPRYFHPFAEARSVAVSFVGANYGLRARYLAHLLDNQVDVHVWGPGWYQTATDRRRALVHRYTLLLRAGRALSPAPQTRASAELAEHDFRRALSARFPDSFHPPCSDEELIRLYSRSHISLGFLEVFDQHDPSASVLQHLHLREFEAPMSGALYCTGYCDELAEFFEPDAEVVVYRSPHELLDKARYYLARPEQAERVRRAGHARALRDHTYHRRFENLFRELKLGGR